MAVLSKIKNFFMKIYNLKIKASIVEHDKFLGNRHNSTEIYDRKNKNIFFSPFNISFIHINRLILVNFEEDPNINGIELQILKHGNQDYPIVILFKKDESQDVYYTNKEAMKFHEEATKKLLSNPSFYIIEKINYLFDIDDNGLNVSLSMIEKDQNTIEFKIRENVPKRNLSAMLAPVGASTPNPKYFPYIYLDEFGLVVKKKTEINVKINDIQRKVSEFPVRVNGKQAYMVRFSFKPILAYWNNSVKDFLHPIETNDNLLVSFNDLNHELVKNGQYLEIKKISKNDKMGNELFIDFSPPIPQLSAIKENFQCQGKFSSGIGKTMGIVIGNYEIERIKNILKLVIKPSKAWQPFPGKSWVSYYEWTAIIDLDVEDEIRVESQWQNNKIMTSKEFAEKTSK
jgi:hypothetical protein